MDFTDSGSWWNSGIVSWLLFYGLVGRHLSPAYLCSVVQTKYLEEIYQGL